MLTEYLQKYPLIKALREEARQLVPKAADTAAWSAIAPEHRSEILEMAEQYANEAYPMRTASAFLAFVRDGSRIADEKPYFSRRRKLCAAALGCCLPVKTEEETARRASWLDDVINGIWCICEESSWVISAHNVNAIPGAPAARDYPLPDTERPYVDLFSAQTGMILSFILRLLEEDLNRISPEIAKRIRRETDRRVLQPFMETDDFWWMGFRRKDLNNWTPWIVSNVLYCAVLSPMDAAMLADVFVRGFGMLDRWLDCVPADGGCDEGAGYWNMAGGALLDCLELLDRVTEGSIVFWKEEKIRNMMLFPLRANVGNGWFLNFADCDARPFISGERIQTAGEKTGEAALERMGRRMRGTLRDQLADVPHLSRVMSLLFHPSKERNMSEDEQTEQEPADCRCWLPDLQAGQFRRGRMTLCCKGGHNGESHNHNDVGTFMLYVDGEPEIVDAGNMTYTAKTFSSERYTLWNTRSAWHNVPMIGGTEQRDGAGYRAENVVARENGVEMELAAAYPEEAGVKQFHRTLMLNENEALVEDRMLLEGEKPVTWVFLLRNRPAAAENSLRAGQLHMHWEQELSFSCEEKKIEDPRMARSYPGSLWRVCLTAPSAVEHRAVFHFYTENE